jgi:hypothetical protein
LSLACCRSGPPSSPWSLSMLQSRSHPHSQPPCKLHASRSPSCNWRLSPPRAPCAILNACCACVVACTHGRGREPNAIPASRRRWGRVGGERPRDHGFGEEEKERNISRPQAVQCKQQDYFGFIVYCLLPASAAPPHAHLHLLVTYSLGCPKCREWWLRISQIFWSFWSLVNCCSLKSQKQAVPHVLLPTKLQAHR